jgi:hypothetical protein
MHQHVRIRFWRVRFDAVPAQENARQRFLFDQWDRMAREVAALTEGIATAEVPDAPG